MTCGCATQTKNVKGEVFGKLKITDLAKSVKSPNGKINKRVLAECECGVIKEYTYRDLKRGDTKSCGCYTESLKVSINIGDKFNFWTVLKETDGYIYKGDKTGRAFSCKCICGEEREINLQSLKANKSKSCGCQGLPKKVKEEKYITPVPVSIEEEKWEKAFGFEGYYISTKGNLFTTVGMNRFINKQNRITAVLCNKQVKTSMNIPLTVYKTFIGDFNLNEYRLIHIDGNIYNFNIFNLFLARLTKSGQRCKIITIKRKHIIEQYIKQKGLSTFLKIPMDLTGADNLTGISVDRIDNDKDYEPGNITLVTRFENMGRRTATFDECMSFCAPLICDR